VFDSSHNTQSGAVYTDFGITAYMLDCSFIDNVAQQSGASWFSFGNDQSTVTVASSTFVNGTAKCCYAAGYGNQLLANAALTATNAGMTCADVDSGGGGASCCFSGKQYTDGKDCLPCINGGSCSAVGSTLAVLKLKPGYWRASSSTSDTRNCWLAAACAGDSDSVVAGISTARLLADATTSSDIYCAPGYSGPCE
jgi:hypothetical protein